MDVASAITVCLAVGRATWRLLMLMACGDSESERGSDDYGDSESERGSDDYGDSESERGSDDCGDSESKRGSDDCGDPESKRGSDDCGDSESERGSDDCGDSESERGSDDYGDSESKRGSDDYGDSESERGSDDCGDSESKRGSDDCGDPESERSSDDCGDAESERGSDDCGHSESERGSDDCGDAESERGSDDCGHSDSERGSDDCGDSEILIKKKSVVTTKKNRRTNTKTRRTASSDVVEWVPTTIENAVELIDSAVVGGYDSEENDLWIIRARFRGQVIPGTLNLCKKKAVVPTRREGENVVKNVDIFQVIFHRRTANSLYQAQVRHGLLLPCCSAKYLAEQHGSKRVCVAGFSHDSIERKAFRLIVDRRDKRHGPKNKVLCITPELQNRIIWTKCSNGDVPKNALVAGRISNEKLYIGREIQEDEGHPGKGIVCPGMIQPSHGLLYVTYDNKFYFGHKLYEVLCLDHESL